MIDGSFCQVCGRNLPAEGATLWDERTYCVECVQAACPALSDLIAAGGPLEETLAPEAIQTRHFARSAWKRFLVVGVVFTVPFFPSMIIKGEIAMLFLWTAAVALAVGTMFAIVTAGAAASHKREVPRTVSVEDGEFRVTTRGKPKAYDIRDCQWQVGSTQYDPLVCHFAGVKAGIVVRTPDGFVACGLTPEHLALWTAFFRLTRLPEFAVPGYLPILGAWTFGLGLGGVIGIGIGSTTAFLTDVPSWKAVGGFIGAIDGALAGTLYRSCDASGIKNARSTSHPATVALIYLIVGLKFTRGMDATTRVVCGIVNVIIGILVGRACQKTLHFVEDQRRWAASLRDSHGPTELRSTP